MGKNPHLLASKLGGLRGVHGHPLERLASPRHFTAWVAGDLGLEEHQNRDGHLAVAEFGGGYNTGPVQVNLSLGRTAGHQNKACTASRKTGPHGRAK